MIDEMVQIQEIDLLHIDSLVLDHLQFADDHLKLFVLDIVIVIEKSTPIELHHIQDTLTFNERKLSISTYNSSLRKNRCRSCSRSNSRNREYFEIYYSS